MKARGTTKLKYTLLGASLLTTLVFQPTQLSASAASVDRIDTQQNTKGSDCYISNMRSKATCYQFDLPLNYNNPTGSKISVHVTVLPASGSITKADPLFIFAGGPGQAAGDYGGLVQSSFHKILEERPIILMDQRGTGKSEPLDCDDAGYLPTPSDTRKMVENCLRDQKYDVQYFDSLSIIKDSDQIRQALGYQQMNLWGGSWGTRLSAYYAMIYPEHVRSMILDGVLPTETSLFMTAAESAQKSLDHLIDRCAQTPACQQSYPTLRADITTLLDKAERGGLIFDGPDPVTGERLKLTLSRNITVEALRSNLYAAESSRLLPVIVTTALKGNLSPLMAVLMNGSNLSDSMYLGSTLSILCAEEVETVAADTVKKISQNSFARDSYHQFWSNACSAWGKTSYHKPFKQKLVTDIPTLVLSGEVDPVTPSSLGDILMQGLSNGRHIIVKGTGHNTGFVSCMPTLMDKFIDDLKPKDLDVSCMGDVVIPTAYTGFSGATKAVQIVSKDKTQKAKEMKHD